MVMPLRIYARLMSIKPKDIIIKPIKSEVAREFVRKYHYSGKVVQNSQLHFGCYVGERLGGVLQFGSCTDKKKMLSLVTDTGWNDFIELNRMVFVDWLPRNSESRCIAICMRLIKKHYPNIKWVISFADATQCGDGTIYRASGFLLTNIKKNNTLRISPAGQIMHSIQASHLKIAKEWNAWQSVPGFQLRYIYFIDKSMVSNLTVPILSFDKIDKLGAGMYKGEKITLQARREKKDV